MPTTATNTLIETLSNGSTFEMVKVLGGSFMMGSDRKKAQQPVHQVILSDFWLGKYPVTQELWEAVMGDNPSYFKGSRHPVEQVSWDDIQHFLQKLNEITGAIYRLPSEAEWEYAGRGGSLNQGLLYSGSNNLKEVGWIWNNSHGETRPVGLKWANELGLHDMSGNVWEWCADHWFQNYKGAPTDGTAWNQEEDSNGRVVRGGSWRDHGYHSTVLNRIWFSANFRYIDVGFRLARY